MGTQLTKPCLAARVLTALVKETSGIAGVLARSSDYPVAKEIVDANMDALRTLAARGVTARKDLAEGLMQTGQELADGALADYGRALIEEARAL